MMNAAASLFSAGPQFAGAENPPIAARAHIMFLLLVNIMLECLIVLQDAHVQACTQYVINYMCEENYSTISLRAFGVALGSLWGSQ